MKKKLPKQDVTFIVFHYKDGTTSKTIRNLDTAISILDSNHESIKAINWNGVRFTVEELQEASF